MKLPQVPPYFLATLLCASLLGARGEIMVDPSFQASINAGGHVKALALDADGRIVAAGEFSSVNGQPASRLVRLLDNGQVDAEFSVGSGPNGSVNSIAINEAGELAIGGSFNSFDGVDSSNIAKLLTGGALDTSFSASTSSRVLSVAFSPDGQIVAGGPFSRVNGAASTYVGRLDDLGTADAAFQSDLATSFAMEAGVEVVAVQADGKIIAGGIFNTARGFEKLVRLQPDGALDASFSQDHGPILYTTAILPLANGQLLVGGLADANGIGFVRRLNSDGTVDGTFAAPAFDGYVNALAVAANGTILVGGSFNGVENSADQYLVRLQPDGTLDTTWTARANGPVFSLGVQEDGKVIVGGAFTEIGGAAQNGIARLVERTLRLQALGTAQTGAFTAHLKAVAGKTYVIEASTNLSDWATFSTNTASTGGLEITDTSVGTSKLRFFRARLVQ